MRHARALILCTCLCAALPLLASCGGALEGIGNGIDPTSGLDDFFDALPTPVRSLEGSMAQDGAIDPDAPLRVGDDEDDRSWRAFTSFELNAPDPGETLSRALLEVHQGDLLNEPYLHLGLLFVERIDMGPTRDLADFAAPAGARSIGSSDASLGVITFDVTALVEEALLLALARVDMRLRFGVSVKTDSVPQQTHFTSFFHQVAPVSLPPILRLTWARSP